MQNIKNMKTAELTRKELYDIVLSTRISKLTQQYALSNDGIKKICKQFEIPMPDGGYWMKLKFNKEVNIKYDLNKQLFRYKQQGQTSGLSLRSLPLFR
ncbi:hypothetical protein D3C86_1089660 [compost metagenome]